MFKVIAFVIASIATLFMFGTTQTQAQSSGLSISPLSIEKTANPGDTVTMQVEVRNIADIAQRAELEARDFEPLENGQPDVLEAGVATSYGISDWFVAGADFIIEPFGSVTSTYEIVVPDNASDGNYYGSVLVRPITSTNGAQTSVAQLVFITIGDPVYKGSVESVVLNGVLTNDNSVSLGGSVNLAVTIANEGDFQFVPEISARIYNSDATFDQTFEVPTDGRVLPKSTREYVLEFQNNEVVSDSKYTVEATATLPDGTEITGGYPEETAELPEESITSEVVVASSSSNWPWIIGGVIFVAAVAVIVVVVLSRKKNEEVSRAPITGYDPDKLNKITDINQNQSSDSFSNNPNYSDKQNHEEQP